MVLRFRIKDNDLNIFPPYNNLTRKKLTFPINNQNHCAYEPISVLGNAGSIIPIVKGKHTDP